MINFRDFESFQYQFAVKNMTSGTPILNVDEIQLLELQASELVLSLPVHSCSQGHRLYAEIILRKGGQELARVSFTAKVQRQVAGEKGTDHVTLFLEQYQTEEWERFNQVIQRRQQEIREFLKSTRGLE